MNIGGAANTLTNNGTTTVNGTLTGNLTNNAGTLVDGTGTITGNLTNSGTVSPGNSGLLTLTRRHLQFWQELPLILTPAP